MKYLIFSPFQAIESHSYPEVLFSQYLAKENQEILFLGCEQFLKDFCIAHASYGLKENSTVASKKSVCEVCKKNRKITENISKNFYLLDNFYTDSNDNEIESIVQSARPDTIQKIYFHDIPVGRIAAYELLIHYKIADITQINNNILEHYKLALRNSLKTLIAMENYYSHHKIDRVFLYNSAYSINSIVREVSLKKGIPLAFLHASFNLKHGNDSVYFSWKKTPEYDRHAMQFFENNYNALNLDYSRYKISLDHIQTQLQANSVFTYSSQRTQNFQKIIDLFKLDKNYKKVVLLSMSSFDEAYANDFSIMNDEYLGRAVRLFASQVEWVKETIDFFRDKKQYKLIIRVHPREFPNKREQMPSPRVAQYKEIFQDLPENISVDYPDNKNSIYDLFEIIDLHLTSQTTTGCESAILGIRGIACIYGIGNYPMRVINPVPNSKVEYFQEVKNLLEKEELHSVEIARKAFHWYLFLHTKPVIFFNTHGYWQRVRGSDLLRKIIRKLRIFMGLSRFSLLEYLKKTSINNLEKNIFTKFAESGAEEILKYRYELEPKFIQEEEKFKEYLRDLFSIFYNVSLHNYSQFHRKDSSALQPRDGTVCKISIDNNYEEVKLIGSNNEALLCIPKRMKIAVTIANYLSA